MHLADLLRGISGKLVIAEPRVKQLGQCRMLMRQHVVRYRSQHYQEDDSHSWRHQNFVPDFHNLTPRRPAPTQRRGWNPRRKPLLALVYAATHDGVVKALAVHLLRL